MQVDVPAETIGEFVTYYFAENGRRIEIIGQLSANGSVQFLGLAGPTWGTGMLFIYNLKDPGDHTGSVSANSYNQNWGVSMLDANRITNITCGDSVDTHPAYLPRSPINSRAA